MPVTMGTCSAHGRPFAMLNNMPMTVTCQCLMSIPKNVLGQDVPATIEMPTTCTVEHTEIMPTTFDKNPVNKLTNLRQHDRQCVSGGVFLWGPYKLHKNLVVVV